MGKKSRCSGLTRQMGEREMIIKSEKNGHIIEHDEESHKYTIDGKPLCGVTTILSGGYPKNQRIYDWQIKEGAKWVLNEIGKIPEHNQTLEHELALIKESPNAYKKGLEEACDIGHLVHEYAYQVEAKKPITKPQDLSEEHLEIYVKCCEQFDEWKEANGDEIVALEELVCSTKYKYAGRFDRLANRKGVITLSDYKTSSGFYITQFVQMAAYAMAIEEWMGIVVDDIEIVRFDKKTGKLSTRNLTQLANTIGIKPETCFKQLKKQFITCLDTFKFKDKFDRYIRK